MHTCCDSGLLFANILWSFLSTLDRCHIETPENTVMTKGEGKVTTKTMMGQPLRADKPATCDQPPDSYTRVLQR
jgi:hypothetical protein